MNVMDFVKRNVFRERTYKGLILIHSNRFDINIRICKKFLT